MARIWVGDFRLKEVKRVADDLLKNQVDNLYFFDDSSEYSWFSTVAVNQFVAELNNQSSVIIMIGFNDCVNSCVWSNFKIANIAINYANIVNGLAEQHTGISFYFCSVNPVNAGYPFSGQTDDIISSTSLNSVIEEFNKTVKSTLSTNVKYLDIADYSIKTYLDTRDGIRFTADTSEAIINFILSQEVAYGGVYYVPRLSVPDSEATSDEVIYWRSDDNQGYNPFGGLSEHACECYTGDTLPNCTAYAWGRFYEILGEEPKLSKDKVELWYDYTDDGYKRGQEPALGAIMCWKGITDAADGDGNGGKGHVAIVEEINSDGTITTSDSIWNAEDYWWLTTRKKGEDCNWGQDATNYEFQGFIYCPTTVAVAKEDLCTKNSYSISIDEMKPNAQYIWQYLGSRGWSKNAVAALLGNLQAESKMSPCVWESLVEGSSIDSVTGAHTLNEEALENYYNTIIDNTTGKKRERYPGYGLVQWTAYTKLYDWCQDGTKNGTGEVLPYWDMDSQLARIIWEADNDEQWGLASYNKDWKYKDEAFDNLSFKDFTTSTKDTGWLAAAFAYCYEKSWFTDWVDSPDSGGLTVEEERLAVCTERDGYATYWYSFLGQLPTASTKELFKVTNFKIDKREPTEIAASFLVRNGASGSYKVLDNSDNEVTNGTFSELPNLINAFEIKTGLKPNAGFKLQLEVTGTSDETYSGEIPFDTPQDYPAYIKSIELTCDNTIKSVNSKFSLKVTKPEYLGYWSTNGGYELQLIVNGKIVKTETINEIKDIEESFTIKEKFDYECKTGDIIQIGIITWVKDENNKPLYNNNSKTAKTSKPICLLNRPVLAYLNID